MNKMTIKRISALTATGLGGAARRAALLLLTMMLTTVTAWAGEVTVTGETTEWTDGNTYNVTGDVTIDTRITVSGTVTLNLGAGATLTASKGIEVSEGNTLTIEGDGTLNATGDSYTKYYSNVSWSHNCGRAGIGAENVGTIIINSGNINATGGAGNGDDTHGAAGIGGSYNNTTGGSITIKGGVVNATGTEGGAGIGGGYNNGGGRGLPGSITINGGQVTATGGYDASGIGKGRNAGAGQATLTLGWTKMTDFIHASSIGSGNDFSSITFVEGKKFAYEGTETVVTASNIVEKDDNGKKIVPLITMTDLSNAVIGNVNTNYTYSGSEISITPAVSLDNNVLTGGEDYTVSYTKGGNSVTAVQEPGVYTLTVTGAGSLFHGSKSFVFSVQGSVNYQAYENGTLTDKPSLAADGYTTVVPSTTTMSAGWYVVSDNVTVSDRISVSGDVHLVLCDGATLTAQNGIGVTEGNSLTIYSQPGNTGKLVATVLYNKGVNFYHAAIGGDRYNTASDVGTPVKAGSITIHGGDITATSYFSAAGIGKAYEGKAGNISIYGGKVTASCNGESGIGIGGDEAVIQLGYARTDDYIQSLGYIGSVTVASDRKFATDDATPVDISGSVGDLSSINGKKLTPKTYTVSFSLGYDGGTAPVAQTVYHGLTKATAPTAPTRTGYDFGGWKNGGAAYDFAAAVTSDLTLTAAWTPIEYTITYYGVDGATFATANPTTYTIEDAITLNNPTMTGYTFTGWTGSNGDTPQTSVSIATGSHEDKTYTANWKKLLSNADIAIIDIAAQKYDGTALTPVLTVSDGQTPLVKGKDYTVSPETAIDAGTYTLTLTGIGAYDGTATRQFTVSRRAVTLTSATDEKTYDGTALTNDGVTEGGDGFADGEGATYSVTGTQTDAGSSANTFTYTLNDGTKPANYDITTTEGTLTVEQKAVTVTADDQTKEYGEADPTLTATVEGLLGDDAVTYTVSREAGEAVGTYAITPTGNAEQGNYAVTYVSGTMTVTSNPTLALAANQAPDGNYWTTFYCGDAGYTIDDGENACAYTAEYDGVNSQLTLHNQGKDIPQGTAVIIVADNDEVSMTKADLSAFSGTNNLRGVDVETSTADIQASLGTGTFYVLGNKNSHFGFHKYEGSTMAARKAFVLISGTGAALAPRLTMVFDDATGITTVHGSGFTVNGSDAWYSLDGRRLQGKPTKSGVYVNNGKKIVIK